MIGWRTPCTAIEAASSPSSASSNARSRLIRVALDAVECQVEHAALLGRAGDERIQAAAETEGATACRQC